MITRLAEILHHEIGYDASAREIAELLYLAEQITPVETGEAIEEPAAPARLTNQPAVDSELELEPERADETSRQTTAGEVFAQSAGGTGAGSGDAATTVRVASAIALPGAAGIAKALRPLLQRYPSRSQVTLDLERTIQQTAECGVLNIALKPVMERWLDIELVVDEGGSMRVWQPTVRELKRLLDRHGAFRNVRVKGLNADDGQTRLFHEPRSFSANRRSIDPKKLTDPDGRSLIIVLSDCLSEGWRNGGVFNLLAEWGERAPVALAQVLPERLWPETALPSVNEILKAPAPGAPNNRLEVDRVWFSQKTSGQGFPLPVMMLEEFALAPWARMIAARGDASAPGLIITRPFTARPADQARDDKPREGLNSAEQSEARVMDFKSSASPTAFRLACFLASLELSLPVMRLTQQAMLPQSRQIHLAEVFLGGLFFQRPSPPEAEPHPDEVAYEFYPGVQNLLLKSIPKSKSVDVISEVSRLMMGRLPFADDFRALLAQPGAEGEAQIEPGRKRFGFLSTAALQQLGFLPPPPPPPPPPEPSGNDDDNDRPLIHNDDFEDFAEFAEMQGGPEPVDPTQIIPTPFTFETVTLDDRGKAISRRSPFALQFVEKLAESIALEMVQVPGGTFLMGTADQDVATVRKEFERYWGKESAESWVKSETPQHEVTISPFFIGKFTVTQAQWRVVASWEKVERDLNPEPSSVKGDDRPVERVNWFDAMEFCARLARETDRAYRLPTEAEWEYACRAETMTPFAFGETITPEFVNYDGARPYGKAKKGKSRGETIPVGSLGVANSFGIFDLHGNVWEWCGDWYGEYLSDPQTDPTGPEEGSSRVLRGGSWSSYGNNCRSAYRYNALPDRGLDVCGLRVVVARTPEHLAL